ncbi:MAG: hydroxymethylglutaryl-CoA lyase, partial [Betaproteobacteria bacterium]|nr:hydroxymethylglutaryl-CoA lyase [Betaproteobacteria bacterium]
VSEVGPRDGLQNTKQFMPTEYKKKWISAAAAAGIREIEVCSFVPPKLIPQMVDAEEVVTHSLGLPGLTVAALAPNLKGAERAMAAGAHKITLPISVSRSHSLANVRRTPDEAVAEAKRICALRDSLPSARRPKIEAGLSTVFGCTIEGSVSEDEVVRLAVACVEAGCDEVGLADTTGYANPEQIRRVFRKVRAAIGERLGGAHLHNTRGLGLANVVAALEVGVRTFDSSLGGLGGCPFAPGASGNIVTEDLVFMLEAMGLKTGIDLGRLIGVRAIVAAGIPEEPLYGYVAQAGITKGFTAASARAPS